MVDEIKDSWKNGFYIDPPCEWKHIFEKIHTPQFKEQFNNFLKKHPEQLIFPHQSQVFNAFKFCQPNQIKVVILGQDPYYAHPDQAMGLSFSVPEMMKLPKSLITIFKALYNDLKIIFPDNGNLTRWAKQGVLLLNTSLTVYKGYPNSHQKYWSDYTDNIISEISEQHCHVVFMLWGNFAKSKKKFIDSNKHLILEWSHPATRNNSFITCTHFSVCNNYLIEKRNTKINW